MCSGALIGFLDIVNSNSLPAIEDYCLALKEIFMDRVMCCPLAILQKSCPLLVLQKDSLEIVYLGVRPQFSAMGCPEFGKGLVFCLLIR
jgi:hypothetical protein